MHLVCNKALRWADWITSTLKDTDRQLSFHLPVYFHPPSRIPAYSINSKSASRSGIKGNYRMTDAPTTARLEGYVKEHQSPLSVQPMIHRGVSGNRKTKRERLNSNRHQSLISVLDVCSRTHPSPISVMGGFKTWFACFILVSPLCCICLLWTNLEW